MCLFRHRTAKRLAQRSLVLIVSDGGHGLHTTLLVFPQLFARSGDNRVIEGKRLVIDQFIGRCLCSSPATVDPPISYFVSFLFLSEVGLARVYRCAYV